MSSKTRTLRRRVAAYNMEHEGVRKKNHIIKLRNGKKMSSDKSYFARNWRRYT